MKTTPNFLLSLSLVFSGLAGACYTGPVLDDPYTPIGSDGQVVPLEGTFDCSSGIVDVLAKCQSCHGATPVGAPNPMVTRDQLMARSASQPSKTVAEVSLERMQNPKSPMPPTGLPPQGDVAVLSSWIDSGMPAGTCAVGPTDPGVDPPPPPPDPTFTGGTVCTTGSTYTGKSGTDMRPGEACNACHKIKRPGAIFAVAGTVYATGHEPNDCVGQTTGSLQVVLTSSSGSDTKIPVSNRYKGNFTLSGSLSGKYTVRIQNSDGSKTREMKTELNLPADGDCNRCHTEKGASNAPGRIAAP